MIASIWMYWKKPGIERLLKHVAAEPGERYATFFGATNTTAVETLLAAKSRLEQVFDDVAAEPVPGEGEGEPVSFRRYAAFFEATNAAAAEDVEMVDGVETYVYDSHHVHEFSGNLTQDAGEELQLISEAFGTLIRDGKFPDLKIGEFRLYCQIRAAAIRYAMTEAERQTPGLESEEAVRRLNTMLTPVPVLAADDDKNCPICREPFEQATEDAVRLPCGHLFGASCLETWVRTWEPGHALNVCPTCRAHFDVLSPNEQADGFHIALEDSQPGLWLDLIISVWSAK